TMPISSLPSPSSGTGVLAAAGPVPSVGAIVRDHCATASGPRPAKPSNSSDSHRAGNPGVRRIIGRLHVADPQLASKSTADSTDVKPAAQQAPAGAGVAALEALLAKGMPKTGDVVTV